MRKVLISVAAAASALALAAPASAQYYPAPQGPVHGYGYNNNQGSVRSLQVRIDRLQQRIARFDSRDRISEREARRLREESRDVEKRLYRASRNGLNPQEYASVNTRIQRLEQRVFRNANDGNRWGGNDQWRDRDRDGRNDR